MASKYQQKTETKDTKAIARPQTEQTESSTDNGTSTPSQPKSKPKYEVEKLETATNSLGEVFQTGDLIWVKDLKARLTTAKMSIPQ